MAYISIKAIVAILNVVTYTMSSMKTRKKSSEKIKKIWITAATIVVILAVLIAIFLNNVSGSTKPIKEVADQFQPPTSWKLDYERVTPPRFMCLDGGSCPEIARAWRLESTSFKELRDILKQTSWTYEFDDECKAMDIRLKDPSIEFPCSVDASTKDYYAQLYIEHPSDKLTATIFIRPR